MSRNPNIPADWLVETIPSYGVVITSVVDGQQDLSVTVNEDMRGFKLGMVPVRERGAYAGRGWQDSLYRDAVQALLGAMAKRKAAMRDIP